MVMSGDPAVAFGMTIGAGLCTTLGAALAFCVNLENKRFLAVSLACAAGVMVYVSMIEIFNKSLGALSAEWCPDLEAGETCPKAYGATTAFFFAGLALCALLNVFTHNLEDLIEFCRGGCVWKKSRGVKGGAGGGAAGVERGDAMKGCATETANSSGDENVQANSETRLVSEDDDADLERGLPLPHGWHVEMTPTLRPIFCNNEMKKRQFECPRVGVVDDLNSIGIELSSDHVQRPSEHAMSAMAGVPNSICACDNENCGVDKQADKKATGDEAQLTGSPPVDEAHAYKLKMTGLITGIAIAIHNFPEGLATFVSAMADPELGAAIAVAIAIHNIPEGVCVAMPIFYATGSKRKAFFWATLSGISEPIGALFGWAILAGDVNNTAYGAMFGLVAGMMIYISLAELLPAAYRYDSNPVVITSALVFGMVAMALSLVLFVIV